MCVLVQPDSDISEYTYEKTLKMEQRYQLLQRMHLKNREAQHDPQIALIDNKNIQRKLSRMSESESAHSGFDRAPQSPVHAHSPPSERTDTQLTDIPEHDVLHVNAQVTIGCGCSHAIVRTHDFVFVLSIF